MSKKNPRDFQYFEVCFDKTTGNLLNYYQPNLTLATNLTAYQAQDFARVKDYCIWENNVIFKDKLEYKNCYSTRGSAHFVFKSLITGRESSMFLSSFDEMLKTKKFIAGIIEGEFTFHKKGNTQGIRLIIE
jgi:hypothetical protein